MADNFQMQEQQRLHADIQKLEMEIQRYQAQISHQTNNQVGPQPRQNPAPDGNQTPSERSKLDVRHVF